MNTLRGLVARAFAPSGALADADAHYVVREAQQHMAQAVAAAIEGKHVLVVEAGTGVGKTFAYLVPTLLSGKRALISTATKNLQDQLFLRDLPRLRKALKLPFTLALLKGRVSYLCLHRLSQARQGAQLPDRWAARTLAKVELWSQSTVSGDLAEMDGLDDRSSIIPLVTSTRENCLGSECADFRQCHVMKARREAMGADLVVVNHHLFFADMALRDTGVAELLPSVEVAVFDEAHQLPEAGVQFLGMALGSAQIVDFARDLLCAGLSHARGLASWQEIASRCEASARALRLAVAGSNSEQRGVSKLRWDDCAGGADFATALKAIGETCQAARTMLDAVSEVAPDFPKLAERAAQFTRLVALFSVEVVSGRVRWIDLTVHQTRLVESPLDMREALRQKTQETQKAWIFTSATLGDDESLSWFTESAGLHDATTLRVGSPFDYAAQARLYIPTMFPKPSEPQHPAAVAALAVRCARALGGRTFVLTTTLRALKLIGQGMRHSFEAGCDGIEVLEQGSAPKRQLLQQFLTQPRSVLVGSQSFWEGIDVPGAALQCVLIDKLPFPPPNDPLVEARAKRLESEGRNPFNEYFVAEAAVSLKQGAGRLIRSETDYGLLVVCDPRMSLMSYGRRLQAALPPMARLDTEAEAMDWLDTLCAHSMSA